MTPPPTWEQLQRVAALFHLRLEHHHGRLSSWADLISTIGVSAGEVLASPRLGALDREDADRVMRAMVAAALVQLGPGAQVDAAVLELATRRAGPDRGGGRRARRPGGADPMIEAWKALPAEDRELMVETSEEVARDYLVNLEAARAGKDPTANGRIHACDVLGMAAALVLAREEVKALRALVTAKTADPAAMAADPSPPWDLAMVVHEVRNTLVPARHHLDRAVESVVDGDDQVRVGARALPVRRALERVLSMATAIGEQLDREARR